MTLKHLCAYDQTLLNTRLQNRFRDLKQSLQFSECTIFLIKIVYYLTFLIHTIIFASGVICIQQIIIKIFKNLLSLFLQLKGIRIQEVIHIYFIFNSLLELGVRGEFHPFIDFLKICITEYFQPTLTLQTTSEMRPATDFVEVCVQYGNYLVDNWIT